MLIPALLLATGPYAFCAFWPGTLFFFPWTDRINIVRVLPLAYGLWERIENQVRGLNGTAAVCAEAVSRDESPPLGNREGRTQPRGS